jgi:TetR/AcrR family transcriptional regulator, regulator of cefoperazone and chloramphenicol sensitivity
MDFGIAYRRGGGNPISRSYSNESRQAEAAKTRRRILDAARRLFVLHGYEATSVARVAEEAGVSPQTVYNSVGPKRALLAALQGLVDEAGAVVPIQRRIAETDDPREVIALVARLRRQMMDGAGDVVGLLAGASASDAAVGAVYVESQGRSREGIARAVARLDALGALREGLDPKTATEAAYAIFHHAVWSRLVDECGWTADEAERWYADLAACVLLAPPT